jgi:acyl-CoA reductase-like NAD-dependent aldehyde dehydrogenase
MGEIRMLIDGKLPAAARVRRVRLVQRPGAETSGLGRQNGVEGFERYLETKAVAWPSG